ncbi:ABC transporter substrate-binding protein [Helicobacter pylori]|uniref:ABC transporter substrate-binding protein n=1 Tax=Helicobacter pylori TaxID=210 RepID=UPI0001E384F4|nr:ABC transporter substrate-binding protein [Helicobacter pylori]ADN80696.1 iron III ABC transporter [Helicobacter pylori 908]ADZ52244.1 iron III ABC transporter, periplasmic iron-binding protein [Helicobacter pylori 2018]
MLVTRFKKAFISYFLGVLVVSSLLLNVCNASAQEVKVKDYFGEQTIKLPVSKIAYIGSYVEVPAMLNVWDRVVGVSDYAFKDDIVKATLKGEDLKRVKRMSTDHTAALNVELLKKLSPDLVVTFVGNPKAVEHAKKFGISFLSFQETTIAEAMQAMQAQATVLEIDASKKFAKMQETLDFIAERLKGVKKKKGVELFHKANKISGHQAPRAPLISLFIALKAHPEAFKGVDINAIVKDYYKVVFDLNDAEVEPFLWH